MLGFCDDSDVLTLYVRLMVMIMTCKVSYANYLDGSRWRVVRINDYQSNRQDTCFFFWESDGPSQVYTVYDIHRFCAT